MKALIFGTILFDFIDGKEYIGGCSANVASHCAKLGAETTHLSRVGADRLGEIALWHFRRLGVDTGFIAADPEHATGTVEVTVNAEGQPEYVLSNPAAYDFIELDDAQIAEIKARRYDFLYFGTVDQRAPVSFATLRTLAAECGCRWIFCDINLRESSYSVANIDYSLASANILKLNQDELQRVPALLQRNVASLPFDEDVYAEDLLKHYDLEYVILTKSETGAVAYGKNRKIASPAKPIAVKDSVGAGDAFSAAFILQLIATGDVAAALDAGNALGGYVASHQGAVPLFHDYPAGLVAGLTIRDTVAEE